MNYYDAQELFIKVMYFIGAILLVCIGITLLICLFWSCVWLFVKIGLVTYNALK